MANPKVYQSFFGMRRTNEILKEFLDSLLSTNRTYDFFVDWHKVQANVEKYKIEIGILGTLTRSANFRQDLERVLLEYPKTAHVLPLLIAVRDTRFDVLEDLRNAKTITLDFQQGPTKHNVQKLLHFVEQSGIQESLFQRIKVLHDYLYGVEVGLDTNARKNRSGAFMERAIGQVLNEIKQTVKTVEVFPGGKFNALEKDYGLSAPAALKERKPDFSVRKGEKLISIEVNFYSGQGSKPQEIVDAYINRQRELRRAGWHFVWITDGNGWKKGQNQIAKAIQQMEYVMNISFAKCGFLQFVIEHL